MKSRKNREMARFNTATYDKINKNIKDNSV